MTESNKLEATEGKTRSTLKQINPESVAYGLETKSLAELIYGESTSNTEGAEK